jgi:hypothetical protein
MQFLTQDIPSVDPDERRARSYRATMAGVKAPHTSDNPLHAWCNFWNGPGLWDANVFPSKTMLLTGELNRRGLNR